jgi:hypothetical protein
VRAVVGLAAAVAVALAARVLLTRGPELAHSFTGTDGLVTNEFAYHNPADARWLLSPSWWVTSGSLFRRGNAGDLLRPGGAPRGEATAQNPAAGGEGVPHGVVASSSGMRTQSTG